MINQIKWESVSKTKGLTLKLKEKWLGNTHSKTNNKKRESSLVTCEQFYLSLWMQSPLGYVVLLLFWEPGTQKIGSLWNWSINSLTPSALHDVVMWNTNKKIIKTWQKRNSVAHLCFIYTSMSNVNLSDYPSAAISHIATEFIGMLVGRFNLYCHTTYN